MKKRVFALLLCLIMCLSLLPISAFADDDCRHEGEGTIVKIQATCGLGEYYRCIKCGELFTDAGGQNPTTIDKIVEAAKDAPKADHNDKDIAHVGYKEESCWENGNIAYWVCSECGQKFVKENRESPIFPGQEIIEAHHNLYWVEPQEATCTENGHIGYNACYGCTTLFAEDGREISYGDTLIPPKGHDINPDKVPAEPHTCWEDGRLAYFTCNECDAVFSDSAGQNQLFDLTDPAGHTKTEYPETAHTCEEDGNSYYFYCSACNKYYDENEQEIEEDSWVIPAAHEYEEHPAVDPTCTNEGNLLYYTCDVCGKIFDADKIETTMDAMILGKVSHSLKEENHHEAVPKTCYENGSIEYWQCDSCGACFTDAEGTVLAENIVIPASHEFVATEATKPTCTEDGNIAYWTCSVEGCGVVVDENGNQVWSTVIPAAGHALQIQEGHAATCFEEGNEAYYVCDTCGKLFQLDGVTETSLDEVTIPKLTHEIGDLVPAVEPTCTEDGHIAYYECALCHTRFADAEGETILTEDEIVLPKSHEFELHPAKEATCSENGNIAYSVCKNCEIVLNENGDQIWLNDTVLPATGHKPEKIEATATCTEAGVAEHCKCSVCGKLFKDAACTVETSLEELTVAALGHSYDSDGQCTRCGAISPNSPAFNPQPVTVPNNDNTYVVVTVSAPEGVFPANCQLSVQPVYVVDDQTKEAVDVERQEGTTVTKSFTYDIKVLKNGQEIQPTDGSKVKVSFALATAANENLNATVYHVTEAEDGTKTAEALETKVEDVNEGKAVVVETDGFSEYTVEFGYKERQYVMTGSKSVKLTEILDNLKPEKLSGEILDARVSSPELLSASKNEAGEWIVTTHKAFQSEEKLIVKLVDSSGEIEEYEIKVTDAPAKVKVKINGGTANTSVNPAASEITVTMTPGTPIPVTITATPVPSGKTFEKWTVVSGIGTTAIDDINAATAHFSLSDSQTSDNVEITANYSNWVEFIENTSAAVTNMPADRFVPDGTVIKSSDLTTPSAEGFVFAGWYEDAEGKTPVTFPLTINSNKTLYAKWQCQVTFFTWHGTAPTTQIVDIGGKVTKPTDLTWIGYKWGGWCTDLGWNNVFNFSTPITSNTILYAKWIPELKITKGDGGTAHYGSTYAFTLNYYYPDYNKHSSLFEVYITKKGGSYTRLSEDHYVVTQDSTKRVVVTLKASYIRTLTDGATYYILFDTDLPEGIPEYPPYDLGEVEGAFKVSKAPKTGDESNVGLWIAIAAVSAVAVIAIVAYLLHKRKKSKLPPTPPEKAPENEKKTKKPPKE